MGCSFSGEATAWRVAIYTPVNGAASSEKASAEVEGATSPVRLLQLKFKPKGGLGFRLWPGALALASFLEERGEAWIEAGKSEVLELGSGVCGLCGLLCGFLRCSPATVTVTDVTGVMADLGMNVQRAQETLRQGGRCGDGGGATKLGIANLDWTDFTSTYTSFRRGRFDLILMSDTVYWKHLFKPLFKTLLLLCGDGTRVLWANCNGFPTYRNPDLAGFQAFLRMPHPSGWLMDAFKRGHWRGANSHFIGADSQLRCAEATTLGA